MNRFKEVQKYDDKRRLTDCGLVPVNYSAFLASEMKRVVKSRGRCTLFRLSSRKVSFLLDQKKMSPKKSHQKIHLCLFVTVVKRISFLFSSCFRDV